jgi:peptide/nickel transport system substrate-binding protein
MSLKLKKVMFFLLATTVLLSGCTGNDANKKTTEPGEVSQSGGQKDAKELVYATTGDPANLDPVWGEDIESSNVFSNIYDTLNTFKVGTTEVTTGLAESYEVSGDGNVYTLKLRKGVKFHDGTPFNAEAVKFNIDRQLPPNEVENMPYAEVLFGEVSKVEIVDEYTVKITLKNPNTAFLSNLAISIAGIASPTAIKKYGDKLSENPVGTGPYKFVKWVKGQYIVLERNEDYWDKKPAIQKITYKFINDKKKIADGLIDGSIDLSHSIDGNDIQRLEQNRIIVNKETGLNINYLAMNCRSGETVNPKMREAIVRAINRDEIVNLLYSGFSDKADTFIPKGMMGYNSKVAPYEFDVEKSKAILKELGKENVTLKFSAYDITKLYNQAGGKALADVIKNQLEKAGFKVNVDLKPWADFKKAQLNYDYDIIIGGWTSDNGDPDNFISLLDSANIGNLNYAAYSNPSVDDLIKKGKILPNGPERTKAYEDMQEILSKDVPVLPISTAVITIANNPKVKNYKQTKEGNTILKLLEME